MALRNVTGWFTPTEVGKFFETLRVPAPANVPRELQRLAKDGLTIKHSSNKGWSLTPEGRQTVLNLVEGLDTGVIESELIGAPGSDFGHALHTIIAPSFAPIKWGAGISRFLEEYPFEQNIFCMTRFPSEESSDPIRDVVKTLREVVANHGLVLHLASDRQIDDDLFGNVAAHMWACQYGIGIFEDRADRGLNHNLMIEIGAMLVTGRRCALIKDKTIPSFPTDLVGHIYKPADLANLDEIAEVTHKWLAEDLQLGKCSFCP